MLEFYKYHGAGNDFVMIDDREGNFDVKDTKFIQLLCHRRFGVGADGILLVQNHSEYDFQMVYINNDGSFGSMCGNGGRCIVHFAHFVLGIVKDLKNVKFMAVDGLHEAEILGKEEGVDMIKLKMQDVSEISTRNELPFLCSGTTPHNIYFVKNVDTFPVVEKGQKIRYADPEGVNINFVEEKDGVFHVRTYERGVEDETLACGTGATSVAIACHHLGKLGDKNTCHIKMPGGNLKVEFQKSPSGTYENIYLTGPAKCVFKGNWQ